MSDMISKIIVHGNKEYQLTNFISKGGFGNVLRATAEDKSEIVIKVPLKKSNENFIFHEYEVYNALGKNKYTPSVSIMNSDILNTTILVMDSLGISLEKILHKKKKIRLKSLILVTIQCIKILKFIHEKGYIHRDIKPDNFVVDKHNGSEIFCIDFGLSRRFMASNKHYEMTSGHRYCGTVRYSSIASHKGIRQSRKDDLESLGYMLIYLFKGKLPWQSVGIQDKETKKIKVMKIKESMTEEQLCSKLPRQFVIFLKYVRTMGYEETPPYDSFIFMFEKLYESYSYKNSIIEWDSEC